VAAQQQQQQQQQQHPRQQRLPGNLVDTVKNFASGQPAAAAALHVHAFALLYLIL
jgi:hypothetical protein